MNKNECGNTRQSFNENSIASSLSLIRKKSDFTKKKDLFNLKKFPYDFDGYGYDNGVLILSECKNKVSAGSDGEKYYYIFKKIDRLYKHIGIVEDKIQRITFNVSLLGLFYYVYNNIYDECSNIFDGTVSTKATKKEIIKCLLNLYESYDDNFLDSLRNTNIKDCLDVNIYLYDVNNACQRITLDDLKKFLMKNGVL